MKQQFDEFILKAIGRSDLISRPEPAGSGKGAGNAASEARNRANAELLNEVFRVVLLREPAAPGEFGMLLGSLNQGASFEGIYNGLTHSTAYRELEESHRGAAPEALHAFATELAYLQADMKQPTRFTAEAAKPLAKAVEPTGIDDSDTDAGSGGVSTLDFNHSPAPSSAPRASVDELSQTFVGASVFTLKRVFGDEALRLIDEKRANDEVLAQWYSKWVVHMASLKVDFGLPLRNKADEKFHYNWARGAAEDLLVWEVLNRVHRVLNDANKKKAGS